ncbi:bloom syndrome [Favolaschia claudopus]|uniref:DNA 3'-5' helicase n=1 Tax=Favolaschia claudopus TaxID=2862362 RepID=A0AAW0C6L3_9AGAR
MPPDDEGRHPALRQRSAGVLEDARLWAATEYGYDSVRVRATMNNALKTRANYNAHTWQLDVAEALLLHVDCLVIAGTGSGKTTPFLLPLLLPENKDKFALIISPLLSLQAEQAEKINCVGVRSVAVNNETMGNEMLKRLKSTSPDAVLQAIFAGPEMIMENEGFNAWIRSKAALERVLFVAVDEAHLIRLWARFRPHYELLARLRSHLPTHIPILATSATITPLAEVEICSTLEIDYAKAFYLNLGNDRPNIAEHVRIIDSATNYDALLSVLPDPSTPARHWPKTQIFITEVLDTQDVCAFLRSKYPAAVQAKIDYLHSHRALSARRRRIRRFRRGSIKILVCTDIGAMGQDIPDISQVIRFGAPESLEVLKQYFGRAGRDLSVLADGHLLLERSCFQTQKKSTRKKQKTAAATAVDAAQALLATTATAPAPMLPDNLPFPVLLPEDQLPAHLDWRKKLDPGLRLYASAQSPSCKRDVSDGYFGNPPRTTVPTGECCDLCSGNGPFPVQLDQPMHPTTPPSVSSVSTPASTPNQHGKRPLINRPDGADNTGPKFRTGVHLANCKAAIERWSYRVIKRDHEDGPFTADMLVSSTVVTYLAHNRFQSLDELCAALEHSTRSWGLVKRYGREVLQLLACLDADLEAQRRNAAREKEEERRQREEERAAVRAAEAEQRRIQSEAVFALRRQAAEARRAEAERVRVEKAERLLARQKERDRARGEKQQKLIHEFIGKLNGPRKAGKAPRVPLLFCCVVHCFDFIHSRPRVFLNTSPTIHSYLRLRAKLAGIITPTVCRLHRWTPTSPFHSQVIYLSHSALLYHTLLYHSIIIHIMTVQLFMLCTLVLPYNRYIVFYYSTISSPESSSLRSDSSDCSPGVVYRSSVLRSYVRLFFHVSNISPETIL